MPGFMAAREKPHPCGSHHPGSKGSPKLQQGQGILLEIWVEAPHCPQLTNHIVRGLVTAQPRNVGLEFRTIKTFILHLSVGQEANSAPEMHPQEELEGEGIAQGRGRVTVALYSGPMLPTQNPNACFDIKDLPLLSPYYSSCHTVGLQGRVPGAFQAAHVSHDSPTWMAEGSHGRTAERGMAGKSEEGTAGCSAPHVTKEPALLCTFLSSPASASHLCQGRDACLVGSLHDSVCKWPGPWLGRMSCLANEKVSEQTAFLLILTPCRYCLPI